MKITISNFVLAILLVEAGQAKSFNGALGQQSNSHLSHSPDDYDYTYGDLGYDYDGPVARSVDAISPSYNQIVQDRENENENNENMLQKLQPRDREPHVVVDDLHNYDYTYGDPEIDYNYEILSSDDYDDDVDNEVHGNESQVPDTSDENEDSEESSSEEDEEDEEEKKLKKVGPIVSSIIEWMVRNWQEAKFFRDQWKETDDHIRESWRRIKHSMKRIGVALQPVLKKFGSEIQEGLRYCFLKSQVIGQKINKGLEAIEKLEKLLEEGNEIVVSFFKLIGHKVEEISRPADIKYANNHALEGLGAKMNLQNSAKYPNLFEDQEVLQKLESMVEANVLLREEADAILIAAAQQAESSTGRNYRRRILL